MLIEWNKQEKNVVFVNIKFYGKTTGFEAFAFFLVNSK